MAYQIDPVTGLPMVGGVPLPLSSQDMAAHGLSQEQAPGGIPMPATQNPYGGLPPNAVAGPGGAPTDLGGPDAAIRLAAGDGQGARLSPSDLTRLTTPQPIDRSHAPAPTRADSLLGPVPGAPRGEASPHTEESIKLLPTVGDAQKALSTEDDAANQAQQQRIFDATLRGGGAGGPAPALKTTSETVKSTQYGAVPDELSKGIAARQDALDEAEGAQNEDIGAAKLTALDQQQQLNQQRVNDAQQAQLARRAVDQRIATLQATSDAKQAELAQSSPKQLSDYWREQGTAAQIFAGLSVALGAGVETRTGKNPGAAVVDGAINRWVNDQKQQYEAKKDSAAMAGNAYRDALSIYGTPEAAEASLRLQALTASDAMAQNMAEQSGVPLWVANAKMRQDQGALERERLRAQVISQAGMQTIEETKKLSGGGGSAADRELKALRNQTEAKKLQDELGGKTVEERRVKVEENKAGAGGNLGIAVASSDAANAVGRLIDQTSTFGGRVTSGAGITKAEKAAAEVKIAIALKAQGYPPRSAAAKAEEMLKGADDKTRATGEVAAQLDAVKRLLNGDSTRFAARHASGQAAPEPGADEPIGTPE